MGAYVWQWAQNNCVVVSACQTMQWVPGPCNWAPEFFGTPTSALYCYATGVITGFNNASCPAPFVVPSYSIQSVISVSKSCAGLTGSFQDTAGGVCTCGPSAVWVTEIGACKPVVVKDVSNETKTCSVDRPLGNPIYPLKGSKRQAIDLGLNIGWLPLTITFDSSAALSSANSAQDAPPSIEPEAFGKMWSSSYHKRVSLGPKMFSTAYFLGMQVTRGNGTRATFSTTSSVFSPDDPGSVDQFAYISGATGGFYYFDKAGGVIETYDGAGVLQRMDAISGQSIIFTYNTGPTAAAPAAGLLLQATDSFGRTIGITYALSGRSAGLVNTLTFGGDATSATNIKYDANSTISSITWPDQTSTGLQHEVASNPSLLTGIVDQLNNRFSTYTYSVDGSAASTSLAGGVNSFAASYSTPPSIAVGDVYSPAYDVVFRSIYRLPPQGLFVTDPLGSNGNISVTTINGIAYPTMQAQPAGSGCSASSSTQAYDANGNLVSQDDFNGNRVCFWNDTTRNLDLTRVDGLPNTASCASYLPTGATLPQGSRKVNTQWHPVWRLAINRAEPGKITTSVYNGQPDPSAGGAIASCAPSIAALPTGAPIVVLCKTIEQATIDTNGSQGFSAAAQTGVSNRVLSWTYNQLGQILTATDPLGHVTTYTYYATTTSNVTMGDLRTVTNAAGQTTTFNQYNSRGQLLQSTDPNGVATTNSYDLRQRLLSTTVGMERTSFAYDAAGQVITVTLPNGTSIASTYDGAHRLTQMSDAAGNKIVYTLDNSGNRIAEHVEDPNGVLVRNINRSFDSLNRVQRVTGSAR